MPSWRPGVITPSSISEPERAALLDHVDVMQADVGKQGFTKRYHDFITAAANHMTVIGPFLPALSSLLLG